MSCAFDLDHYRQLLDAIRAGGYRFASFDEEPRSGDLFLRHDVDLDLEAALTMSAVERDASVRATYFLMKTSVFYNLDSAEGARALEQLRADGHAVGLHPIWPSTETDDRFDPLLAWHNPAPEYMREPVDGLVNVMAEPYGANYRSDSNQGWREGCPHEELAAGDFDWLQLLIHPEIWVYPGGTMRETMEAMLDRERARRLEQLEVDRIDLS